MPVRNGNALRESAHPGNVAERSLHRGGSLNIANLPNDIREQLNLRLHEGEPGRELAAWLNALPEVRSVLGSQFDGAPISEVNLTHWRQGGYLQWLTERECFDTARALAEGDDKFASAGLSAQRLLNILTLRFGQILMLWDTVTDDSDSKAAAFAQIAKKARILQGISRSVLAIHRLQSQSALKKTESVASSSQTSHNHAQAAPLANGRRHAEAAQRVGGTVSHGKNKSANREGTPRPGTILAGPINPSNFSHTPFKPDHDLDEILDAVGL